jgi:Glycosyl hydrolase family 26
MVIRPRETPSFWRRCNRRPHDSMINLGTWRAVTPTLTTSILLVTLITGCAQSALTAPPSASRPSALVQAGDSKTSCIYVGGGSVEPQLAEAERATGVTWNCLETFSDDVPFWSHWVDPWITHANSQVPGWVSSHRGERTLIVSEELIPQSISNDADPVTWEVPCARGEYDGYAKQFASALVGAGEGYSVVRLGMEMNGRWEEDYMGTTLTEQHEWALCFAREVTAMRSVRGAHLLFDWNPNDCTNDYPLADFYPGNAYVDIIGADVYDADCMGPLPAPSTASWNTLYTEPLGLATITSFAKAKGKPMSLPEWGLVAHPPGNGDDPYYVDGIASYVASHDVAFQSYFDGGGGILQLGAEVPLALSAYHRRFGTESS